MKNTHIDNSYEEYKYYEIDDLDAFEENSVDLWKLNHTSETPRNPENDSDEYLDEIDFEKNDYSELYNYGEWIE